VHRRSSLQESSSRIGFSFAGWITEDEEEFVGVIVDYGSQTKLLATPWEHGGFLGWGGGKVPEQLRKINGALAVGWNPSGCNPIVTAPREEHRSGIIACSFALQIFQADSNSLTTYDDLEAKASHCHSRGVRAGFKVRACDLLPCNRCAHARCEL